MPEETNCGQCEQLHRLKVQMHDIAISALRGAPECWVQPWPDLDPHLKIMIAGEIHLFPKWMVAAAKQRATFPQPKQQTEQPKHDE